MNVEFDVQKIRQDFPTLAVPIYDKPLSYLDNAASTLRPNQVIDRVGNYYRYEASNVHRGAHFLSSQGTSFYETARQTVRDFIGARSLGEVIFTRGTTESINLVAQAWGRKNLNEGDEIILSEMEHHSNIVPWQLIAEERRAKIQVIPVTDVGELDLDAYQKLLNSKTKIVAVSFCSNALGTINPVKRIVELAHACGALVLLDAAQAVTQTPIDVQTIDCDFLAFSGHKIFAPYGIGVLYGKETLLEQMPPYQSGGSMIGSVSFEKTTFANLPQKFEAGTPSVSGAIGLGSAIEYFLNIGVAKAGAYKHQLLETATRKMQEIEGLRIIGTAKAKAPIVSFVIEGIHPSDLGSVLDREGVAIRTGHHCTQPLMKRFGVSSTARASFSFYNTAEEIDRLVAGIHKAREFFL